MLIAIHIATPIQAMGKMRNYGMRNAEGKMRNGMCGATVIGCDVTSRDFIYSAFHHTLCVNCVEVNCILSMRKRVCLNTANHRKSPQNTANHRNSAQIRFK